ncbi:protease complex subunit PrcB family protein [Desmospora activa]|uniref:Protease stability complex PrcB-like protein n=1 Tax=Desmospora activa DSM 45169 TaxID=1121389 RepID=A0A2T4ZCY6_9BACL|nr:protease complex subunit PrcB family protein [Desmospora activa]PTM59722.1 protease stability complex PrcB-like protein [Desmospora activa DSM 45169]
MTLRQVKWIMMGILFVWSITGCGTPMSDDSNGGTGADDAERENVSVIAFKNEPEEKLPASVQAKKEELLQQSPQQPEHVAVEHQGTLYAIIASSQKPTGGYTIRVNQVEQNGDKVTIHAEEIAPPEDGMVIQVLTTPVAVISFQAEKEMDIELKMEEENAKESPDASRSEKDQPTNAEDSQATPTSNREHPENAAVTVQTETVEKLPVQVKEKAESLRTRGGETTVHHDGRQFVIIALGERRTGGYQVEVEDVEERGNEVHVYAREIAPETGAMVIQAITYPLAVVSFKTKEEQAVNVHLQQSDSTGKAEV